MSSGLLKTSLHWAEFHSFITKTVMYILTTGFTGNSTNLFCNIFSSWKLKVISSCLPRRMIKVHLKQCFCLLGCTGIPMDVTILVNSRSCCTFHICHCKTGHCLFWFCSEHLPKRNVRSTSWLIALGFACNTPI